MGKFKDLTGQRFGRLTVIERAENNKFGQTRWRCKCDCGAETTVQGGNLSSGHTKSCGCMSGQKHRMTHTKIYTIWATMLQRCFDANCKSYSRYGERGITVYPEWIDDFQAFYNYVLTLPHFGEEGYTLDRIDNNGNYEPGNLRWADKKAQCRNRRSNVIVEYEGKKMTLAESAELSGINYCVLWTRLKRGDRGDRLFRAVKN